MWDLYQSSVIGKPPKRLFIPWYFNNSFHLILADKKTLLIAIGQSINQFIPAEGRTPTVYKEAITNGRRIKSFDVDSRNRLVYWTDSVEAKIYRLVLITNDFLRDLTCNE